VYYLISLILRPITRNARRNFLARRGQFDCSVRVLEGSLPGERKSWKHKISRVTDDGVLVRGKREIPTLIMREGDSPRSFRMSREARVWVARTPDSSATFEVACMPADAGQIAKIPHAAAQQPAS